MTPSATEASCRLWTAVPLIRSAQRRMSSIRQIRGLCCLLLVTIASGTAADLRRWQEEPGYRWCELPKLTEGHTGFSAVTSGQSGITFTNTLDEWAAAANRVLENGSGVAAGDYDHDGRVDLFFASLQGQSKLFRNLGGWKFQDVTLESGIVCSNRICRGAVFADIDGDGDLDLLVSATGAGVLCFLNLGNGTFQDFTREAGTATPFGSSTLALGDVDGDGTLDLYVTNYRTDDIRDRGQVDLQKQNGTLIVPPPLQNRLLVVNGKVQEYGEPDLLYLNQGGGRFKPVSWMDGHFLDEDGHPLKHAPFDWGLSASFRDVNADGAPDLYVCNDYWTPDRLWLNDGSGHFRAAPRLALRHISASSMGVDFADVDRDGHLDFVVVDMLSRDPRARRRQLPGHMPDAVLVDRIDSRPLVNRNTFQHARGDGSYEELAEFSQISASDWSWQPIFLDVDLDGYEDLLISTGHTKGVNDLDANEAIQAMQHPWNRTNGMVRFQGTEMPFQKAYTTERMMHSRLYPTLSGPIVAFENLHPLKFRERTTEWGLAVDGVHHGMVLADLDNDGDLDLVVNNLGTEAGLFRNETAAPRVSVQLKGLPPNSQGIGARVALLNGVIGKQSQELVSGGRYLSGCQAMLTFAAAIVPGPMRLEVHWRSGRESALTNIIAGRLYEVYESSTSPLTPPSPLRANPLFEDVSDRISHTHSQLPYDDFENQPLLPRRLSRFGPGVSWCDLDQDGREDLVVGAGRGGQLAAFRNLGKGQFELFPASWFSNSVGRGQTTILGGVFKKGRRDLLVGISSVEDGMASRAGVLGFKMGGEAGPSDEIPGSESSVGPLVLADLYGSGSLDLFVGGRSVPGRYPENAESRIYRSTQQGWRLDERNTAALRSVGMVSGAVCSDLDGDGFPELILACEWGPVRIFHNRQGALEEVTADLGLAGLTGWWAGVAAGDFDGDGRMDLVASNWGLNSTYTASADQPVVLFYGDLAGRGQRDLLEADFTTEGTRLLPRCTLADLLPSFPGLRDRFPTHRSFSEAGVAEVLGEGLSRSTQRRATTLGSMVFLNRGNRFDTLLLPVEAQYAPAYGVAVGDLDGDGAEDVFLAQNFFGMPPVQARLDAGRGLWLRGDGRGGFTAVPAKDSGVEIYGEQRGVAFADYDGDGRVDLVVSQNREKTKLFHNLRARPGLRVELEGSEGNPKAVGAMIRLDSGVGWGPAREVTAGSGYLSQNGAVQILSVTGEPLRIRVRWPGGSITESAILDGVRRVRLGMDGSARGLPAAASER